MEGDYARANQILRDAREGYLCLDKRAEYLCTYLPLAVLVLDRYHVPNTPQQTL